MAAAAAAAMTSWPCSGGKPERRRLSADLRTSLPPPSAATLTLAAPGCKLAEVTPGNAFLKKTPPLRPRAGLGDQVCCGE